MQSRPPGAEFKYVSGDSWLAGKPPQILLSRRQKCTDGTVRAEIAGKLAELDRLWEVSDLVAMLEADERGLERAA
jgi:hypothetical protein